MSGQFIKRVKKSAGIPVNDPLDDIKNESIPDRSSDFGPPKTFSFKPKIDDRKQTQLQSKFAEAGQTPDSNPSQSHLPTPTPNSTDTPKDTSQSLTDTKALSFLNSDNPTTQKLKAILQNGLRIISENAEKKPTSTGIREIPLPLPDRLQHFQDCDDAFKLKTDDLLRSIFFPKRASFIPDADLIAKGEIFATPKFLKAKEREVIPTEDRVKKYLERK